MPTRAKRPCKYGYPCTNLVDSGYCEQHEREMIARRRQEQNDDPMRPYYKGKRWVMTRLVILARDPICQKCFHAGSQVVHHVIDARVWVARGNDFFDESNLVGWCKPCHDSHTATTSGFASQ